MTFKNTVTKEEEVLWVKDLINNFDEELTKYYERIVYLDEKEINLLIEKCKSTNLTFYFLNFGP